MATRGLSPTGTNSILAIGVQGDTDTAVKVQHVIESRGGGIEGNQELLYGEANLDSPSPRHKVVAGNFSGGGDFSTEVTPRRAFPRLLYALFGTPIGVDVSPATPSAPTLAKVGAHTGGATTRKYFLVLRNSDGVPSIPSAGTSITTTVATLSVTHSVTVTYGAIPATQSYDILRASEFKADGTTPSDVTDALLITNVTSGTTYSDNGSVLVGTVSPTVSVAVSTKTWKHTEDAGFLTFAQKKGKAIFASPGGKVHKVDIGVSREQKEVIMANFGAKVLDQAMLSNTGSGDSHVSDQMTNSGLATALYDDLVPFSPARAIVAISEVDGTLIDAAYMTDFKLTFDRNSADEYCLNGKLGPYGFRDSVSGLDIDAEAYFKPGSEQDYLRFMGHASTVSKDTAYGFTGDVKQVRISLTFLQPSGYGFNSILRFTIPRAAYGSLSAPVGGRTEAIKQKIRVEPIYDGTAGTDLIIEILSSETATAITTASGSTITMPATAVQ